MGVFGLGGSWKSPGGGWVLEEREKKEKKSARILIFCKAVSGWHLQAWLLACSQSDKVRICCLALLKTYIPPLYFLLFLRQRCADEAAYINPVYSPLFLLKYSFLPAVTAGTDWLRIMFDSPALLSFWSQRSKRRRYTTMTVICVDLSKSFKSRLWRGPVPHTHTRTLRHLVDPVLLRSGGKRDDGIIHCETKILSWSMEPSTVKFTVATPAPAVYNVAGLSCANWHFSVHKSPKKKKIPSSPVLWGFASCIHSDLNLLIREDIRYSPPVICAQ